MTNEAVLKWAESLCLATLSAESKDNFVDKHFGYSDREIVSDSDLIHRCVKEHGGKKQASAFIVSREEAMKLIRDSLTDSYTVKTITKWANDWSTGKELILEFDVDKVIGKMFAQAKWHEWNAGTAQCSVIRIVLSKDEREWLHPGRNFFVKTAYPIMNEEDFKATQRKAVEYRRAAM